MCKIDAILSRYANVLRSKSLKQLKNDFHMVGGSIFNGNKEDYIKKIVNFTQNNQAALQNVIKLIQKGNSPPQKASTEFKPLLIRQLNKQKLKQIVDIQRTKKGQYAKIGSSKTLVTLLKQQLSPGQQTEALKRALDELKKNNKFQKQKEVNTQQSQNKQQKQSSTVQKMKFSKRKNTQPKKISRQFKTLVNDYQSQKTQQQLQKQKQYEGKINLLHSLNIQTQIILPNHLVKQNYQNSEEQIKLFMENQDPNSFSRYIRQKVPKQFKRLRIKQKKTGLIRLLSEAVNVMRILKEVNYNKFDILHLFMRDIYQDQKIKDQMVNNPLNKKIITQFIKQEIKHRKYYSEYMSNYSIPIKTKIATKILNFIKIQTSQDKVQQQSNIEEILKLFQFSFFFQKNLLISLKKQQNNPQIDKETLNQAKIVVKQAIRLWIKFSRMMKINSLDKMADLFRVLVNFNNFINYIDNVVGLDQQQIEYGDYYENITKQIHISFTNLFYPDILPPELINQLIINFEKVLGEDQLPNQILKSIANMANMINKQLKSEAKKSIIKIFGIRPPFKDDNIITSLIRHVVEKPILYGLMESLLAVELAIKYQLDHKETIVRNIILFNIDPKDLNEEIREYLNKLVKENVSEHNQNQILQYLQ